jgi:hypothetical protein
MSENNTAMRYCMLRGYCNCFKDIQLDAENLWGKKNEDNSK